MTQAHRPSAALASFWALAPLALTSGVAAQEIRLGLEFQVNTFTANHQREPAVAADADGDFVVVWESREQDGSLSGVFAQRFSSAGTLLAAEFQVNVRTGGPQYRASVAADAEGDFVVAWQSYGQDGSPPSWGVFARRFSSGGEPLATEFQVNAYTIGAQDSPAVAVGSDGDFVVAWQSDVPNGVFDVFARRFSSSGLPLADEFQVNAHTTERQGLPSVAADADGDFVVAWHSDGQDGSSWGIFARRFSSTGAPLADELQIHTYTANNQYQPRVAADVDGDFVVAWRSYGQDSSSWGIFARRFSSAGVPLATEFQVNTYTSSGQIEHSVAADAGGDFVVVWRSPGQDGDANGVFGRHFSSAGQSLATEFQVHSFTANNQIAPAVAFHADGDFVVAWGSDGQNPPTSEVFAQRFAAAIPLDIDLDGSVGALTDGLLVLRSLFGLTGVTLTGGAVGESCGRCDAAAIEPYLAGLGTSLDVDGNAALGALTDGLLVLRYLFGLTGVPLTGGAVGGGCSRCDAAAIEPYLAALTN